MLTLNFTIMKKITLAFISLTLLSLVSFGQSILILDHAGNEITGQTITEIGYYSTTEITQELGITNNGAADINIVVRKAEIDVMENTSNYFCLNACFPSNVYQSTNTVTIAPGETLSGAGGFSYHFFPNGIQGASIISYTFFNADTPNDTVQVIVNFEVELSDISDNNKLYVSDVYPNPATNMLHISYDINTVNPDFKVYNILGSEINDITVTRSNTTANVDISNLSNGVYFYSFISEDKVLKQGKFVINK